jgi:hypothetical protein
MNLVAAWPRFMRPDVAAEYVGGRTVMDAMIKQKLVKPKVDSHRLKVYDRFALDAACDAFEGLGEDGE